MNIFYLDYNPYKCAEMHVDKHCIKMILEYAQLLSTAHRYLDGVPKLDRSETTGRKRTNYILSDDRNDLLYRATHINHPSAVWVRQSDSNYIWLANLLICLCEEYTFRYGKVHKVERDGLCYVLLKNVPVNITYGDFTQPTPAMPEDVKIAGDSIASYRNYYKLKKQHLLSWKGKINSRSEPQWMKDS